MAARDVMCAALPEKYANEQPCFLVQVDQLAAQSYRSLNEGTLMGRSHQGVKRERPFVVSGMLISINNFHDCCQCEIDGMSFSF